MAKSTKKDVGKGIRALLSNIEIDPAVPDERKSGKRISASSEIAVSAIEPNPFQPRTEFDQDKMDELAQSIKTFGVIQPITVRRLSAKKYQIITGERRWRASKIAGLDTIPAFVREANDQGMLEMALLENIQRTDLNPMEVALSYQRLIDECSLTHEELSARLGKKRSSITNYLRVLKLSPEAQKAVKNELISLGHAKVLAGIKNIEDQLGVLEQILANGLSVRDAEKLAQSLNGRRIPRSKGKVAEVHAEIRRIEDKLGEHLGSRVKIARSGKGSGSIRISFSSDEELNSLVDSLIG